AQRGESAFAAIVQRHGGMVLAICRRILPCEDDAADAFQATFLVLVSKAGSIRGSVGGWLHGVAHRVARAGRTQALRRRWASLPDEEPAESRDVMTEVMHKELYQVLGEELERLPVRYRDLLILCYLEGKTHEEAARALHVPRGSMTKLLTRAR